MTILDTNLWVFGTLRTNERAAELLDAIDSGETTSAINAYIVQEVVAAFERTQSLSPADRDAAQTQFLARLSRMTGLIEAPSSSDVAEELLNERRSATHTRLLAQVLDIQPKDVPIVVLAFDHYDGSRPSPPTTRRSLRSIRQPITSQPSPSSTSSKWQLTG